MKRTRHHLLAAAALCSLTATLASTASASNVLPQGVKETAIDMRYSYPNTNKVLWGETDLAYVNLTGPTIADYQNVLYFWHQAGTASTDWGGGWAASTNLTQIGGASALAASAPSIATGNTNQSVVVAWQGTNGGLWLSWATAPGVPFRTVQISAAPLVAAPAVAMDSTGIVYLAAMTNDGLEYYQFPLSAVTAANGKTWAPSSAQFGWATQPFVSQYIGSSQPAIIVRPFSNDPLVGNIAGTYGEVDIAFQGSGSSLYYIHKGNSGVSFSTPALVSNLANSAPSMAFRRNTNGGPFGPGEIDIVCATQSVALGWYGLAYYYAIPSSAWQGGVIGNAIVGSAPSLTVDPSSGIAYVAANDNNAEGVVYEARPGTAWSSSDIINEQGNYDW